MKKIIFLLIVLIISACAPQVTVTSEVTATLTPPPTETPIPTPTLHPEFIAWQELISSSGRYTLTPDGLIQDNGIVMNGLQVDSNGVMTLTVNNEKIVLNTSEITFAEDGIKINGYELNENGEWVEAQPRLANGVGEPVLGPNDRYYQSDANGVEYVLTADNEWIRTFPICNLQKLLEGQYCNFEQLADLSEFADFVQTQLREDMFDPAKINWVEKFEEWTFGTDTILLPNPDTAPNYTKPGSAPFIREDFTGRVQMLGKYGAFVTAVPQFIPNVPPEQWPVMIGVGEYKIRNQNVLVEGFRDGMNIVAWRTDFDSIAFATQFVNPATGANFTEAEVRAIMEEMRQGNFANTHGLVLKIRIGRTDGTGKNIYK